MKQIPVRAVLAAVVFSDFNDIYSQLFLTLFTFEMRQFAEQSPGHQSTDHRLDICVDKLCICLSYQLYL